ncbi:MAG TPA: sigma-E factor negative regulatory protein [Eoetvoesiella sp.]
MQVVAKPNPEQEVFDWESTVSGWIDGDDDIRPEDLDSPYGRQVWDTYHLIGDVLRSEELAIKPSDFFYARISKAIDAEPAVVAPHRRKSSPVRLGLSGLAVVAAVASVAWVAQPYFSPSQNGGSTQMLAVATPNDDAALRDYVDAHRQLVGINPVRQVSFDGGVSK